MCLTIRVALAATVPLLSPASMDAQKGRPHSDALHVTERFRRTAFGHMEAMVTIDDPKAYVRPGP